MAHTAWYTLRIGLRLSLCRRKSKPVDSLKLLRIAALRWKFKTTGFIYVYALRRYLGLPKDTVNLNSSRVLYRRQAVIREDMWRKFTQQRTPLLFACAVINIPKGHLDRKADECSGILHFGGVPVFCLGPREI